jgi:hypothetical protein
VADIFEEVEEQLRSDRYIAIARRSWPFAAGAAAVALALALGLWGWDHYQSTLQATASEAYSRGLDAVSAGDRGKAEAEFGQVAKNGPRGYRTLAIMQQGALRLTDRKTAEAIALFDEAAKVAPDQVLADAARLKAAFAAMDNGMALPELEARLTPLTGTGRPYHVVAREALAMARLSAGKTKEARGDFQALSLVLDADDATRNRAQAAVALIDSGAAANIPAVLKVARTLPPALSLPAPPIADPAGAQ